MRLWLLLLCHILCYDGVKAAQPARCELTGIPQDSYRIADATLHATDCAKATNNTDSTALVAEPQFVRGKDGANKDQCCFHASKVCTEPAVADLNAGFCKTKTDCGQNDCGKHSVCCMGNDAEQCPNSTSNLPLKLCSSDSECFSQSHDITRIGCTKRNKPGASKGMCCPTPNVKCLRDMSAVFVPNTFVPKTMCDPLEYKQGNGCCRNLFSASFSNGAQAPWPKLAVAGAPAVVSTNATSCTKHDDCGHGNMCDNTLFSLDGKTLVNLEDNKGGVIKTCFKLPQCAGEAVRNETAGVKTCINGDADCGKDEFCDMSRYHGPDYKGVCCLYVCEAPKAVVASRIPPAASPNDLVADFVDKPVNGIGKHVAACTECHVHANQSSSHGAFCVNLAKHKAGNRAVQAGEEIYACCQYEKKPLVCAKKNGMGSDAVPLMDQVTGDYTSCPKIGAACGGASSGRCVEFTEGGSTRKRCCSASMCDDHYTMADTQSPCNTPKDCPKNYHRSSTKCQPHASANGTGFTGRCCPVRITNNNNKWEYPYSFFTKMKCKTSAECGLARICHKGEGGVCFIPGTDVLKNMTTTTCNSDDDCDNEYYTAYCIRQYTDRNGYCIRDPMAEELSNVRKADSTLKWAGICCGCGAFFCFIIAVVAFLKYRSRHFCDHRKKKKDKKDKKKDKKDDTATKTNDETKTKGGESESKMDEPKSRQ